MYSIFADVNQLIITGHKTGVGHWEIEAEGLAASHKFGAYREIEKDELAYVVVYPEQEVHLNAFGTFVIPAQARPLDFVAYLCAHFVPLDIRLIT